MTPFPGLNLPLSSSSEDDNGKFRPEKVKALHYKM